MRLGVPAASPAKWGAPGPPPAVTETGEALRFAHDGQRTDRDVVLQAVKQYGTALEFAGEGLEADKVLVLQAVTETGAALQFAHDDLRKDRDVALQTVTRWLVTESAEDLVVNATQWLLCSAPTRSSMRRWCLCRRTVGRTGGVTPLLKVRSGHTHHRGGCKSPCA